MTIPNDCQICHCPLVSTDRVIFSHKETFIFKPADVPDTVNAAQVSPAELAESRKDHLRTAIVNTFVDWGKATIPQDAYYFRHQWCEPVRTGDSGSAHPVNKHGIRFGRAAAGRLHG